MTSPSVLAGLVALAGIVALPGPLSAQLPEKHVVRPEGDGAAPSLWSPGVLVGNTLYVSGMTGIRPGEASSAPDVELRRAFENLRRVLLAAGMDYGNVVSCYIYLEDIGGFDAAKRVFREVFARRSPAVSTLGVGRIPGEARILVQAIAVQDNARRQDIPAPPQWKGIGGWPGTLAVRVNGTVYLSAMGTADPETGEQADVYTLRIRQAMLNTGAVLRAAGVDYGHVVFVNPYLGPGSGAGGMNAVYRQFFEFGDAPARATLAMSGIPGGHAAAISAVAVEDLARRAIVRPISRPLSATASPAVFAGDALYFSGFSGFMPGYGTISDDFPIQVRFAMRNIQDGLEAAGLTFDNVVSVNAYLADAGDYERMLEIYGQYFPQDPPALTVVQQSPTGPNNRPLVQFSAIAVRSITAGRKENGTSSETERR